jgi:ankyrin repeat protein
MEACRDDNADMVLALVDVAKMDVNQIDTNEKSALHYAAIANSQEVCTILLRARADVNVGTSKLTEREIISIFGNEHAITGMSITPLMIAIGHSNEALTEILLAAGADPDLGAASPLIIAASNNDEAIFDCLIKKGADLKSCSYINQGHRLGLL